MTDFFMERRRVKKTEFWSFGQQRDDGFAHSVHFFYTKTAIGD